MTNKGWIGVDLDGTLAYYDEWKGSTHIGEPIPAMVRRIKRWLSKGITVKICTARACGRNRKELAAVTKAVKAYCKKHIGVELEVTNEKDYGMIELWDDQCVQVIPNTGRTIADELKSERLAKSGKIAKRK